MRESLEFQLAQHARKRHSLLATSSRGMILSHPASPTSFTAPMSPTHGRRPSTTPSLLSLVPLHHPVADPATLSLTASVSLSTLLSFESKLIAQYLTLADFYIFKCITSYEYLRGRWRDTDNKCLNNTQSSECCCQNDYIGMLTKRANMLSHWVAHELCTLKTSKQRRTTLRKFIEIAKYCVEWNNFHTSMVITMGLLCLPVQKLEEWQSLPNRDANTYQALQNMLDVGNNMAIYRQALAKANGPTIPFFPMVLKDLTFLMDGNPTELENPGQGPPLVNFGKFRTLAKFVQDMHNHTSENYGFAGDLEHLAFFPGACKIAFDDKNEAHLDVVAEMVENRVRRVSTCYTDPQCETQLLLSLKNSE
ncbi:ras guanine nucleotide exchange factor domain-containing protein [Radiomyces spectabilis]|uniref:ras guanine nucleotide exchange factor domain-containing protein n=1 Tax=Radiomyces spectabilis TaxID=64574 RepID=UPI00221F082D|nr:ras guanine nucleotide exchange factor domain-containing protein [Radiomyces spectabilis]KAI8377418.1 ras guanine nucleotide exchange factor domain-containing protein [Radiomyces spectabilis]